MRILMLTCHPGIRGPFPKVLPLLAETLRSLGCHVVEEPWGRHSDEETRIRKLIDRPADIWRVWCRLKREPFDVLFIHTTTEWANYSRDIPVLWLCRRFVKAIVLQFHGSCPAVVLGEGKFAFKRASRMVFALSDTVFVLSSEEQLAWKQFCSEGSFQVICNPFKPLPKCELRREDLPWRLAKEVPLLLFAGRLITEKGIYDLLDALARLADRIPFHLLVLGEGPEEHNFKQRVNALKLEANVTLAGYVTGDILAGAYQAADLFVLPSWSEGFPTVLTEAMHAGLPIVTTRIRGALDHLEDGVHACFVPPQNPAALADAIMKVLSDAELQNRMGEANREKVRDFGPEKVGNRYFASLREVCEPIPVSNSGISVGLW